MAPKAVIVGAGISGLSLAFRLRQRRPDVDITILEKADRPGGNIWTERDQGFQVEIGPNGFLDSNPSTIRLCQELGIADRLIPASDGSRKNRYLFWNGRLQALPGSFRSFITTRLLSWRGKLSLLLEKRRRRPADAPDDESVYDFAARRTRPEVADLFADAMVTGIHAGDPKLLSIRSAFPRVAMFERQHGSVMRGFSAAGRQRRAEALARGEETQPPRMWSFREGLRLLIESLRDRCGARLLSGVAVRDVIRHESRWLIRSDRGETWDADAVALTCHAPEQAAQLRATDPELATLIAGIPYAKIAVVALGFRADQVGGALDGFGYIAPQSSRRDILGVQWCSSIFPDRAPQGMVIWRALCGGWHRPDVVDWDDDRLANAVRSELRLAQQVEAAPVFRQIIRWPRAIPQYHVGHARRVELIDDRATRWPGLFLGGNAYRGVAMNDCVEQSSQLAERLIERLNARADQST